MLAFLLCRGLPLVARGAALALLGFAAWLACVVWVCLLDLLCRFGRQPFALGVAAVVAAALATWTALGALALSASFVCGARGLAAMCGRVALRFRLGAAPLACLPGFAGRVAGRGLVVTLASISAARWIFITRTLCIASSAVAASAAPLALSASTVLTQSEGSLAAPSAAARATSSA